MKFLAVIALLASLTGCNWLHVPGAAVQLGLWAGAGVVAGVADLVEEVEGDEEPVEAAEQDQYHPASTELDNAKK